MTATDIAYSGVPQEVAAAVLEVYDADPTGDLPRNVLDRAKAGDKRLRGYFEWDDTVAGEAYRLQQAAAIVRRVWVKVLPSQESPPVRVRALIPRKELPSKEENATPGSYIRIEEVAGKTAYEVSVADAIKRDLLRLERKYRDTQLIFAMAEEVFG